MFRENYAAVRAYALRRAPRDVVQDVVAETFLVAWRRLDERQEMVALADVLKEVRFDPHGGTISITLAEDALKWLGRKRAIDLRACSWRYSGRMNTYCRVPNTRLPPRR